MNIAVWNIENRCMFNLRFLILNQYNAMVSSHGYLSGNCVGLWTDLPPSNSLVVLLTHAQNTDDRRETRTSDLERSKNTQRINM